MNPRIFVSAVTAEFGQTRQLVANVLSRLGYEPDWEDIFGTESGDLRQMLREKIDECDGLIQLVGRGHGAEPPTVEAEFGRVSYTQFEFLHARARGKKTWLIFAGDGCTRDHPLEKLDLPRDPTDPNPAGYQSERRALQEVWRQRWKRKEHVYYEAANDTELELKVERLKDEFAELRRAFRWWQRYVTHILTTVAALVLLSVGINLYVARQQHVQVKTVQELTDPVALGATIRRQIKMTAEEKINALPDEKGRWRLVAEIEKERDLALGRVDDLIKLIQEGLQEGASPVFQRASEILQKEGTDEALAYLENSRPSTLETVRRQNEQIKSAQARLEAEKEQRNKTLQALVLEAELLETKLKWTPALALREQVVALAPDWFVARIYLGKLLSQLARNREAEPHDRAALALATSPTDEAIALNNLAALLQTTNRLAEAGPLMRRALAIDEQSYGAEHPNVAHRLNNLADLLQDMNRLAEAEPLMRRALAIDEQYYGADHPSVAIRLNNLATLLQDTNRLAEAEPLMRRALAIDEQYYGADHPNVAIRLNNLATLLKDTNRLAEAEPLMRRALAIHEPSYGAEHPRVAIDLNNLASLLKDTNRLAEAEPLMRRALAIDEQSYGAEHPSVAIRLSNLADLLQAKNRLAEAEPLMRRALAIDEPSYGAEHPNVAIRLNNLATLLRATNRLAEAEPLMRRALAIFVLNLVKDHPRTITVRENYRLLLAELTHPPDEIERRVKAAMETKGPLTPNAPEVERLLGPAQPVADVLAALDRQYKVDGMPSIYFLLPDQPMAPHLDQLLGRSMLDVPLNEPIVPHLEKLLGPAKSVKEVLETLDRQYREQGKSEIWFLPLDKPISPLLDELLGPVVDPVRSPEDDKS